MKTHSNTPKTIFLNALALPAGTEQQDYLAAQLADDPALRAEVESLLWHHQQVGEFLESGPADCNGMLNPAPLSEAAGSVIGPYKLLEQIGEGGFGVVFMAEQQQPVRRRVALKILKAGMDTREVVARFDTERQALAMMDHRHIAKVLEAGATDTGRPYFVMEMVHGVPITEYCDKCNLNMCERLELFVAVCQAVQHAHQKGIIHRDLKPSNVLVAMEDGKPSPKVIDFGVAKAVNQPLTAHTLQTAFTQLIGTPLYMSPEQAELSPLGVDTRSDIYSLGVLLYELLTGTTPFEKERLHELAYDELRRIIREEEPPRPSARVSTLGPRAETVAENRRIDIKKLCQQVRGDLDWIVMKALEKDRNRRYETASALAADVERYLHDEPVEACPPSAMYRFRKFARRNRGPVLSVIAVLLALLCGAAISTWQAIHAYHAEQQALLNAQQSREAKEAEATQRKQSEEVSKFLVTAFRSPDPFRDGRTITIVDVLDRSVKELQDKFADDPRTKAELLTAIGESYHGLGLFREAIPVLEQARDLQSKWLGPDHSNTLASMIILAEDYDSTGRSADAIKLAEETLKLSKAKLGLDHRITLAAMWRLAWDYLNAGRTNEALILAQDVLNRQRAKLGSNDRDTLRSMHLLASAYNAAAKTNEAIALHEETLKLMKVNLPPDDPDILWSMNNLAGAYATAGRLKDALQLLKDTLKLRTDKLGRDSPGTFVSMINLAVTYQADGQEDEAIALVKEILKISQDQNRPDRAEVLRAMVILGNLLYTQGKYSDAETAFREAIRLKPDYTRALIGLAWLLADCPEPEIRNLPRANQLINQAIEIEPRSSLAWQVMGWIQYREGAWQSSIEALEKSMKMQRMTEGGDAGQWFCLAMDYFQLGSNQNARKWYDQAVVWMEKHDPRDPGLLRFRTEAAALLQSGDTNQKIEKHDPQPAAKPSDTDQSATSGSGVSHQAGHAVEIGVVAGQVRQTVGLHDCDGECVVAAAVLCPVGAQPIRIVNHEIYERHENQYATVSPLSRISWLIPN